MDKQNNNLTNLFVDQLNLYQSANSDKETIKRNFIIRKSEFELIINSVKNKKPKDPLQHELILGRRGSGKSSLLKRIQIEIDEKHSQKFIAINLAEEQASIYRLFDLWLEVLSELEFKLEREIKIDNYSKFKTDQEFTRYLYQIINDICITEKKRIILLLDNFDRIVENFSDDGNLLREMLINYNNIQIIAGSTRMDEHFWQYDKPFYEFFRRHKLEALTSSEINELINHWSKTLDIPPLKDFAEKNRGKIENIRILTDGLPRTLQLFIQILLQNSQLYGYDYLRKVMDNVTPLYQERLNYLTPQLRKIVSEMAFIWEASTTKQLVEKCRMESKLISANLKTLVDKGIVDKIETSKKNHLYRLSERFFNMWLIITQGNPDQKRKAKWLSIFLENWYDAKDFNQLAEDHIYNLKENKISLNQGFLFSKALSQSKYISTIQRDEIIERTENLVADTKTNYLSELPKKYKDLEKEIYKLIDEKEFNKALRCVQEIENEEDGEKYVLLSDLYFYLENFKECEKYLVKSIVKGKENAAYNLAFLYDIQDKYKLAEKYYLKAIDDKTDDAFNNLALLYEKLSEYNKAEEFYVKAIYRDIDNSFNNLALLYLKLNKEKAKALEFVRHYNTLRVDYSAKLLEFIIAIWNGKIESDLCFKIIKTIKSASLRNETIKLYDFITFLLIHKQKNLTLKLFNNDEIGENLINEHQVLYYVTLILNDIDLENVKLKIPPEINDTVNDVIENIKERQKFYGYV